MRRRLLPRGSGGEGQHLPTVHGFLQQRRDHRLAAVAEANRGQAGLRLSLVAGGAGGVRRGYDVHAELRPPALRAGELQPDDQEGPQHGHLATARVLHERPAEVHAAVRLRQLRPQQQFVGPPPPSLLQPYCMPPPSLSHFRVVWRCVPFTLVPLQTSSYC